MDSQEQNRICPTNKIFLIPEMVHTCLKKRGEGMAKGVINRKKVFKRDTKKKIIQFKLFKKVT